MKKHQQLINISGWLIFIVSLTVYILTLEPTTSYWDCSEFILSAAKLEVNHPSGAPFFMLLGRLFSFFSFGNPQKIAWAVNLLSATASAFTILFLFWIIARIAGKLTNDFSLILGSAAIGALTFAFTDSFWFSAVEGEVYALSMFFLSLSLWAVFRWEAETNNPVKWLLFIAFITGLGIGVHLLNLLAIPAILMIVGFKKYGYSLKIMAIFFVSGSILILVILSVLSPMVLKFIAWFDRIFVNNFNMPLHSGIFPALGIILAIISLLIFYFRKQKNFNGESIVLAILLFLIGFSVYSVNVIRSNSNPPINFGRPDNAYSLINYLNREQYPKRPLLKGENFNSVVDEAVDRYSWDYIDGKYQPVELSATINYDENTESLFPRMYSTQTGHPETYRKWIDIKGKKVRTNKGILTIPVLGDQLKFFFKYQLGYMYLRYFMWNFSGRQNDYQGRGGILHGNWISGINFLDKQRLGNQENMPGWLKNNRARNSYFLIPLILGIAGAIFHFRKSKATFFMVLAVFIMAGIGLVIYINEVPITPRERDYVFVGSFMAFSIWVGINAIAIFEKLIKILKHKIITVSIVLIIGMLSPLILISQNYDDHDRSGRFTARDLPANILKSCPPNAILFTNGDNDTYPLLYCQEVEGIRTDVRIVIMPFLSANWFINQLRNKKYNDNGLNLQISQIKYDLNKLDFIPVINRFDREIPWHEAFYVINSNTLSSKVMLANGDSADFIPSKSLNFRIKYKNEVSPISVSLENKQVLYKHELAFWDILASNAEERPICFTSLKIPEDYGLLYYTRSESMVFRLVNEKSDKVGYLNIPGSDPEKSFNQLVNKFSWGNINDEKVNVDYNNIVNVNAFQIRNFFNQAAKSQIKNGNNEKAIELIKKCNETFPGHIIPFDIFSIEQVRILNNAGASEEAAGLTSEIKAYFYKNLDYYLLFDNAEKQTISEEIKQNLYYVSRLAEYNRIQAEYENFKDELNGYLLNFQAYL